MIDVAPANGKVAERGKGGAGGVREYISASRLNTWMSCPLKFRLRYYDGIKTPTSPAMFVGKRVHRALEIYGRHRMLGITLQPGDVAGRMIDGWDAAVEEDEMIFAKEEDEMAMKKQSVDLVTAYLAHVPDDEPAPKAVEVTMKVPLVDPFTGEDLGIPLLGVVDLILPDEGGQAIIDFKTSGRSAPPHEIMHEVQLSCYAYLYRQVTGQNESGLEIRSLVKTKKPKIEFHEYPARTEDHLRRLFSLIREYLDALDSGKFNYRPGWGCSMCDHRIGPCRTWAG